MVDPSYIPVRVPYDGSLNLSPASNRFWDMAMKGMFIPFYAMSSSVTRSDTDPEGIREEIEMQEFASGFQETYIFDIFDPSVVRVLMCDAAELPKLVGPRQIPFISMIAKARLANGIT